MSGSMDIVIAAGGGGIPIVKKADGSYEGVEAVIDKDLTSSILANEIGAEIFIILTEVPCVYTGYGKPSQKAIGAITAEQLGELVAAGEFPPGSMGPKVAAVRERRKHLAPVAGAAAAALEPPAAATEVA